MKVPSAEPDKPEARLSHLWECMDAALLPDCRPAPAARTNVLPFDEWLRHTREVIEATKPWRGLPSEDYRSPEFFLTNYSGPWLESTWIDYFLTHARYENMYPLVPLFVQWTDSYHGAAKSHGALLDKVFGPAGGSGSGGILRDDVLYVTLMTYDRVREDETRPCTAWRNVLIFSSGGWGNVPIPHLKGVIENNFVTMYPQPPGRDAVHYWPRKFASTYTGANTFGRGRLYQLVSDPPSTLPRDWVIHLSHPRFDWMMNGVLFTLAPRGRDRGAWRTYETLQYGRVPVLLHTDTPWVPYQHGHDFVAPGKVAPRHVAGGERDVSKHGAVLRGSQDPLPALAPEPVDAGDHGPQYWGRLVTPGAPWGPGGVGFAMHFDELPGFWCVACEFVKPGSAARWRHVRSLPMHRYGTGAGQSCPCSSQQEWQRVAQEAMGERGNWTLPVSSLLYEMEQRVIRLTPGYFTPQGVIDHVLRFVTAPLDAELRCVPRPSTFLPPA